MWRIMSLVKVVTERIILYSHNLANGESISQKITEIWMQLMTMPITWRT